MHAEPKRRDAFHPNRIHVTIAIALSAAAVAAGIALGHHAEAQGAPPRAAVAEPQALAKPASALGIDPSVAGAAEALRGMPHDSADPTPTF